MNNLKRALFGTVAVCALALPGIAAAQDVTPPLIADIEGLRYEGKVAGLDAWSSPATDFMWMLAPDGVNVIASIVYNPRGVDVGAAMTGRAPVTLEALLAASAQNASRAGQPEAAAEPAEGQLEGNDATSYANEISQNGGFVPPVREVDGKTEVFLPENVMVEAEQVVDGKTDEERVEILTSLVENLRSVQTEDEFVTAINAWRQETTGSPVEVESGTVEAGVAIPAEPAVTAEPDEVPLESLGDEVGPRPVDPDATPYDSPQEDVMTPAAAGGIEAEDPQAADHTGVDPAPVTDEEHSAVSDGIGDAGSSEVSAQTETVTPASLQDGPLSDDDLLATLRRDALWFGTGKADAPVVYAFIDPLCPYCATAIKNLKPSIDDGSLQLRVMLLPIFKDSPSKIAGIFLDPAPQKAFFDHEIGKTEGRRSAVKDADFATLPADLQTGVRTNYDLMANNGIKAVPHFVYDTADGAKSLSGVPRSGAFDEAIADVYTEN